MGRGEVVTVEAVGAADVEAGVVMHREAIFGVASITKPITAAAVMVLVDEGRLGLDDPVDRWLSELAHPMVVRTPHSPLDDVVPAARPITVRDLLESRAGWGFASDFTLPAVAPLFDVVQKDGRDPQAPPAPGEWLAALARIPLLYQPGEAWLYNTCYDVLGVLVARAAESAFPDFLAERLFTPLGMADTGFVVPRGKRDRFTSYYRHGDAGLELVDGPDGKWSTMPAFPSGAGGLVSTVDDWHRFARLLLGRGTVDGRRLLCEESVGLMTTNHLPPGQPEADGLFLEGQGWGYGGSVDLTPRRPWTVPGRYGWVGGTGTAAYLTPATGDVAILLAQLEMAGPGSLDYMEDFWRYAATTS